MVLTAVSERPDTPRVTDAPAVPPFASVIILFFVALGILYLVPTPATITVQGWRMFAIFVCTVLALMLRPLPGGAVVLVGVVITMLTGVLTPVQALAGYGNTAVWLSLAAFLFSRAVINSGWRGVWRCCSSGRSVTHRWGSDIRWLRAMSCWHRSFLETRLASAGF